MKNPCLDRDFLTRVNQSIFANPFTPERHRADCRLSGLPVHEEPARVLKAATDRVNREVRRLLRVHPSPLSVLEGRDRLLVSRLLLFHLFHRYLEPMDAHIRAQMKSDRPLPLECGSRLERELRAFGFSREETELSIALIFQMRRAFFLIRSTLVGTGTCMETLRAHLWRSVFTHDIDRYASLLRSRLEDFSTLLLGETGTGKGVAAAAMGRSGFIPYQSNSHRFAISFEHAFLELNLAQYPEQLLESEIFGHVRGAFTGAVRDHPGALALTSPHGALLLDEIAEVPPTIQIKLLRVLQERSFSPVGSLERKRFRGRLIAATNRDVPLMIRKGKFREDFYFRLCTDRITLPPLRQRIRESDRELPILVRHLVRKITGTDDAGFSEEILTALARDLPPDYPWPGNVRELEQTVRRVILHGSAAAPPALLEENALDPLFEQGLSMAALTRAYCRYLYGRHHTLQAVARITGLDRRTVKKYLASDETEER